MSNSTTQGRLCPTCYTWNDIVIIVCKNCSTELADVPVTFLPDEESQPDSHVEVIEAEKKPPLPVEHPQNEITTSSSQSAKQTVVEKKLSLTFACVENKCVFQAASGDILGRGAVGSHEVLGGFDTVSREHALLIHNGVNWEIEDKSSNGTYINNVQIKINKRYTIKNGDILNFSRKCTLKVIES